MTRFAVKNPVESVVSKNLKMDNFLSEQKESLMDDFIFTNSLETPKQKVKNKNDKRENNLQKTFPKNKKKT